MKKLLSLILLATALTANAQEDYNRARVEFNPSALSYHGQNIDLGKITVTGFTLGYEHGFSLSDWYDCYLVAGAKLEYIYKCKTRPYKIEKEYIDTRITNRMMDINIPVNFMYRFRLSESFSIEPYAGINFRGFLFGKEKVETSEIPTTIKLDRNEYNTTLDIFDEDEMQEYGWEEACNRFHVGWQAGADLLISDSFTVGFSYGTDFTDFGNDSNWTHWSFGVGISF